MEIGVQSISDFVQSTTAHGFSRIHSSHSLPIRCMWVLFLLGSFGAFGYHITMLLISYASTPISANISPGSIQFQDPDITLCSVSPISSSNFYETLTKHPQLFLQLLQEARQTATVVGYHGFGYDPDILMQVSRDMFDSQLLLKYLGHRREFFIVNCKYKGVECNFTDFQGFWDSKYGNCYRFQPNDALIEQTRRINDFHLDLVLFTDTNPQLMEPNSSQVYTMLNAGVTFEGEYDVSKSGGAILFYSDKDTYPRDFINLSPGLHSYVDFQMVEHRYVSRRSKRCLEDGGKVFYEDATGHRIQFNKNRIDCQYRELLKQIEKDCECFSTRIAPPYKSTSERFNTTKCQVLNFSSNKTLFVQRRNCEKQYIQEKSTKFNGMDQCLPNCVERIYTPVISMTSWPLNTLAVFCKNTIISKAIGNLLQLNMTPPDAFYYFLNNLTTASDVQRDFSSNFAQVSIAAYSPFGELIEEVESYQFFDLFSDIGGILGLYLGVSILTVCELFELVFVVISELRTAKNAYKERQNWKRQLFQRRASALRSLTRILSVENISTSETSVSTSLSEEAYTKPVRRFPSISRLRLQTRTAPSDNKKDEKKSDEKPPEIRRISTRQKPQLGSTNKSADPQLPGVPEYKQ